MPTPPRPIRASVPGSGMAAVGVQGGAQVGQRDRQPVVDVAGVGPQQVRELGTGEAGRTVGGDQAQRLVGLARGPLAAPDGLAVAEHDEAAERVHPDRCSGAAGADDVQLARDASRVGHDAVRAQLPVGQPALEGPRGILTRGAVAFYRLGAVLPRRAGFALLRSRAITRVMSVSMAKTRERSLRRWIHEEHDRYFSGFANRDMLLEAFRASVSHDVSDYAAQVRVPTLLIAAEEDDITPLAAQHRLVRLFPDARLVVVPEVGHLVHYEAPAAAARAIREFLA